MHGIIKTKVVVAIVFRGILKNKAVRYGSNYFTKKRPKGHKNNAKSYSKSKMECSSQNVVESYMYIVHKIRGYIRGVIIRPPFGLRPGDAQ